MTKVDLIFIVFIVSLFVGVPVVSYLSGYRPPECCVTDHGVVSQVIEHSGSLYGKSYWDVYYNAYVPYLYHGIVTVNCDYYKVGMSIIVVRNIQHNGNATGFTQIVNAPAGC